MSEPIAVCVCVCVWTEAERRPAESGAVPAGEKEIHQKCLDWPEKVLFFHISYDRKVNKE